MNPREDSWRPAALMTTQMTASHQAAPDFVIGPVLPPGQPGRRDNHPCRASANDLHTGARARTGNQTTESAEESTYRVVFV